MGRYDWPAPPRGEDDPGGRARYLTQLRPTLDPTTIAPLTPKKSTRRRARAVPHNAPSGANNLWFPIGPSVMTNGQAGGNPNVAGRIRDLIVEPTAGLRIYAASGTGGVWFSADRGETWTPLDEFQESDRTAIGNLSAALACGAVHVRFGAAADGSQDEVWIGTGEQSLSSAEALPVGPGGGLPGGQLAGIGFLHLDPSAGPGWTVVKGGTSAAEPDTLRGESFYRIAADPGNDTQLVAGTTKGLYVLPAGGSWTKVASYPTTWDQDPLDVVLTRLTGPDRVRIWVGVTTGVLVAEFAGAPATPINPASLVFTPVRLDNIHVAPVRADGLPPGGTRVQLATDGTTVYVLGRRIALPADKTPPAHAWRIDATVATAALAALRAAELTGVPPDLFMSAGDQSSYDMCIAVHPTVAGRLYVGGAAASTPTGYNGAIYRCELAGTTLTPTLIGEGTHPDVHVLRVGPIGPPVPAAHTVWVGCDGGLFRSDSDGDPNTFVNRNDGLAVLQPGYVASHPTNPGIVVAGFQDNGTAIRVGDGVWEQKFGGDGGGVVFDPASDNRYFRQYVQATWNSSDNRGTRPVLRRRAREKGSLKTSETVESGASLFYSGADAVVHGGDTHLAFGSRPGLVLARLGQPLGDAADRDGPPRRRQPEPGPGRPVEDRHTGHVQRHDEVEPVLRQDADRLGSRRARDHRGQVQRPAGQPPAHRQPDAARAGALLARACVVHRHPDRRHHRGVHVGQPRDVRAAGHPLARRHRTGGLHRGATVALPARGQRRQRRRGARPDSRHARLVLRHHDGRLGRLLRRGNRAARHAVLLRRRRQVVPHRPAAQPANQRHVDRDPGHRARAGGRRRPGRQEHRVRGD